MIKYRIKTPSDELEPGETPASATISVATSNPTEMVAIAFEGDAELIRRAKAHLRWSHGERGAFMDGTAASPRDLVNAIHVSRQLDDYNPERIEDTVDWGDAE